MRILQYRMNVLIKMQ